MRKYLQNLPFKNYKKGRGLVVGDLKRPKFPGYDAFLDLVFYDGPKTNSKYLSI